MQLKFIAVLLLVAAAASTPTRADTRLGDSCDLANLGVKDKAEFLRFDAALRTALEEKDATALALLVSFPLRVNHADGRRVSLANAAALQARFEQTFGAEVRAAVAKQRPEALFCKADGVMYGDGEIWASEVDVGKTQQFRVTAVNVPAGSAAASAPAADVKPLLACNTGKFHVVIDGREGAAPRYRSWNKPHAPPDPPALELVGKADGEGTGACFHRIWRFRNGNVDYVVSEPGCAPDVPNGAQAELEVLIGGQSRLRSWCF